eukprot:1984685-Prorocentrum_lima.AAC.1
MQFEGAAKADATSGAAKADAILAKADAIWEGPPRRMQFGGCGQGGCNFVGGHGGCNFEGGYKRGALRCPESH